MFPELRTDTVDPQNVLLALAEMIQKNSGAGTIQKATGNPVGPYVHGPGGLLGVRGLERDIISTHTQITGSLAEMIPAMATDTMVPLFPFITGFVRSDQQEKDGVCDDPEEAAPFKTCVQTAVFGRKEFKTRELEVNRIGQRINWAERIDNRLVNGPLANAMGGLMRNMFGLNDQSAALAGNEVAMRFVEVAIAFQRWLCPAIWTNNPANSSAGGGYKEFMGLDLLIGTNKIDAISGQACPSLYSDIKDFMYRQVDSTTDPDIVRTITYMMRTLKRRAVQNNMAPADIRMVMREDLFYHLTEIWPCRYITYRCNNIDGANIDPEGSYSVESMYNMKVQMRDGNYLLVDGMKVPVILDDCIMEENHADNGTIPIGGFASDIYFVPFSVRGNSFQTLYWEYFDYRTATASVNGVGGQPREFWSDGGAFLWTMLTKDVWCVDWAAKFEPRVILRTPQLAGRLQNVVYVPLQHTNDPLPSQDYWVNGGVTSGYPTPSPFSEYNSSGPGFTA